MIQIFISWCWIGISAFLWGLAFTKFIKKVSDYEDLSLDSIIVSGLCFLTVFAQFFSLIYRVGTAASILLCIINLILLFLFRKEVIYVLNSYLAYSSIIIKILIIMITVGLMLMISSTSVQHYDSYLYHAQSIRWIEEYGVVKGLGNLHSRLAYNSSFFPIQALFSMRWVMGQSLHSVNGFVSVLLLNYAILTMKFFKEKRISISDHFRVVIVFYVLYMNCSIISSPCSDILAQGLVAYILTKWVTYWEDGERDATPYAVLCMLGVYAVSVKLSVAMIVMLTLMPAIKLAQSRQWRKIVIYFFFGVLIISPFLIWNVIISGYLIYPYPSLDFLRGIDWKMPRYSLLYEKNEIKTWGWGLNDVYEWRAPISVWFPVWINQFSLLMKTMFYINLTMIVPSVAWGIYVAKRDKEWNYFWVIAVMIASFLLWFIGAPNPRFGTLFLLLLPLYMVGHLLKCINGRMSGVCFIMICTICIFVCAKNVYGYLYNNDINIIYSSDYEYRDANIAMLGDVNVFYPVSGDQMGYYAFPSTPYPARLQLIELRDGDLEGGFRMKDEYRENFVTLYGQIDEENMFESN